jgi:hypothetical protein
MNTPASRAEWPSTAYLSAWKTFRLLSNENEMTARHLLDRPSWPRKEGLVLSDIGCGDGRLSQLMVVKNPTSVREVRLVDPDGDLLAEAERCLIETTPVTTVSTVARAAEDGLPEIVMGCDVILLVHVVYLMRNYSLQKLLDSLPFGIPLFVVLDKPDSVFSQLWEKTAPKYFDRAVRAHSTVQQLPEASYAVENSTFTAQVPHPRTQRDDVQTALLSLLSYADAALISQPNVRRWIDTILERHTDHGRIRCTSTCYAIRRRR